MQPAKVHEPHSRPKNPLSAYNLFFQLERKRILSGVDNLPLLITDEDLKSMIAHHKNKGKRQHRKSHGKITFKDLARTVADRWRKISPENKEVLERYARMEKTLFREKFRAWKNFEEPTIQSGATRRNSKNTKPTVHNAKTTKQLVEEQAPKLQRNQSGKENMSRFKTLQDLLSQVETEISYLSQISAQCTSLLHGQAATQVFPTPQSLVTSQLAPEQTLEPCDHQTHPRCNQHAVIPPVYSHISATSLDSGKMIQEKLSHEGPQEDPQAPMSLEPLPFHLSDQETTPVHGSSINEDSMGAGARLDDPLDLSSTGEFSW